MANERQLVETETAVVQGSERVSAAVSNVLSEPYDRSVIRYLYEHPTAKLEELVDAVFGAEVATSDAVATPANREPVRFALSNTVLPRLDALGYVDFDPSERTVTRTDVPQAVFSALDVDGESKS